MVSFSFLFFFNLLWFLFLLLSFALNVSLGCSKLLNLMAMLVDGTAHQALHRCPKAFPSLLCFCCVNHCNPGFLLEKTAEICMKTCRLFWGHQAYPDLCRWIICINFSKYLWINNQTCVKALRRICYILCFFFFSSLCERSRTLFHFHLGVKSYES